MILCHNCGETTEAGGRFCMRCGHELPVPADDKPEQTPAPVCPKCGAALVADATFCVACGRRFGTPVDDLPVFPVASVAVSTPLPTTDPAPAEPPLSAVSPPAAPVSGSAAAGKATGFWSSGTDAGADKKKKIIPRLPVAIGAIALLAAAIAAVLIFTFGGISFGGDADGYSDDYMAYVNDGELWMANVKTLAAFQATAGLLDEGGGTFGGGLGDSITSLVQVTENGSGIFFPDRINQNDNVYDLYHRAISGGGKRPGDAVRIDTDVRGHYETGADGKTVFYIKGDADTLYGNNMRDKVKIAAGVQSFDVDSTGTRLYYNDADGALYMKNKSAAPEKIDSSSDIVGLSPDYAAVYYLKDDTLYKKEVGKDKARISSDVGRVIQFYESGEIYYTRAEDDGNGAESEMMYFYDGTVETALDALWVPPVLANPVRPVIVSPVEQTERYPEYYRAHIGAAETALDIHVTGLHEPVFNSSGIKLYYMDINYDEQRGTGELWSAELTENGFEPPVMEYADVHMFTPMNKTGVRYFTEPAGDGAANELWVNGSAELMLNGKSIDYDVAMYPMLTLEETEIGNTGKLLYYTDYNRDRGRGALKIYDGRRATLIADDVDSFHALGTRNVAYLVLEGDYQEGDLLRYDGSKERETIDTDVSWLCPIVYTGQ